MLTFLITCKMEFMRLGITSIIHDLFPGATLLRANSRQECLRVLRYEKVAMMISDGTVDIGPNQNIVRKIRALQPDIKIIMLLESEKIDHLSSICLAGRIDKCIRKNAPVKQMHDAILHVLSGTGA